MLSEPSMYVHGLALYNVLYYNELGRRRAVHERFRN